MWHGDYEFVLQNLVLKDFKVRYRNMSLGAFWSLLNPLIMMAVLTLVFTIFKHDNTPHYAVQVLCGLVPFNFFALAWVNGTTSLIENAGLIKRVPIPREDMRYVVESANTVLFWMVTIVYSFDTIPKGFQDLYALNPVAAMVMAMRNILTQATAPAPTLLWKLTFASFATLAIGWTMFRFLERRFYDHL